MRMCEEHKETSLDNLLLMKDNYQTSQPVTKVHRVFGLQADAYIVQIP